MNDQISSRQLFLVLWAALMAPASELLPALTAPVAGRAAWAGALAAAPALLLMGFLLRRLCLPGGLAEGCFCALGPVLGRGILLLYVLWGWALLALRLRLCAQRLLGSGYRNGALWFLLAVSAALVLWMSWGKLGAFARTVEIFFWALLVTAVAVVGLTLPQVRPENLLPLWWEDLLPAFYSALPVLGVLGYGVFATLLLGETRWEKGDGARWARWALLGCAALAVVQLVVVGNFGPQLTARLDSPFFHLAKSMGVKGAFQRVESVVTALWTFSDLALLGLLLRGVVRGIKGLCPKADGRWTSLAALIPAMAAALLLFPDSIAAEALSRGPALWGNLVCGLGLPLVLVLLCLIRGKRGSISCAEREREAEDIGSQGKSG